MKRSSPRVAATIFATVGIAAASSPAEAVASEPASGREGFTLEATLGGGMQYRTFDDRTYGAVFGLTLGAGWFVTEDFAVLARVMHSIAWEPDDFRTVAGAAGVVAQYWLFDRVRFEAGPGVGWGRRVGADDFADDWGFGLLTGVGFAVWQNRGHAVTVGVEYVPSFLERVTLHSAGLVVGWQLK